MHRIPRFVANEDDNLHCVQASYAMILDSAGQHVTAREAERETGFSPGKLTWPFAMITSLATRGLWVCSIETLDLQLFMDHPQLAVTAQIEDSQLADEALIEMDLVKEQASLGQALNSERVRFVEAVPTLETIRATLAFGGLATCNVNQRMLAGLPGHMGHVLVVYGISDFALETHDPGPPPMPNRVLSAKDFERAWHFPTDRMSNLVSVFDTRSAWLAFQQNLSVHYLDSQR